MRLSILSLILTLTFSHAAYAQARKFPYPAVVQQADVLARSGPGQSYYATNRLQVNQRVAVHRHDPGGWYMISPPPSSFSWIRAEYVKRGSGGQGELTTNNVIVRVGSEIEDVRDVEQRRLSTGDVVSILGEANFETPGGPVKMFKIVPPRGEYRWVQGKYVAPLDEQLRAERNKDPFASPVPERPGQVPIEANELAGRSRSTNKQIPAASDGSEVTLGFQDADDSPAPGAAKNPSAGSGRVREIRGLNTSTVDVVPRKQAATPENSPGLSIEQFLAQLDAHVRSMTAADPSEWDLESVEQEYLRLQQQGGPDLAARIEHRLASLESYKAIKKEYDGFYRLTSETNQRDEQLLSIQKKQEEALAQLRRVSPASNATPGPTLAAPAPGQPQAPARTSSPTPARRAAPTPTPDPITRQPATPRAPAPAAQPRFDGAGIVQRLPNARPGSPSHILLTPDGRLLAFLVGAPGVNLDDYRGRQMGLVGHRWHQPDLGGDVIQVRGLTPVRLRQP